jgi:type VI secretion system secreted protein Hcp
MRVYALFLVASFALAPIATLAAGSAIGPITSATKKPLPASASAKLLISGHTEAIEVSSFQWGTGRGIGSPTGGSADRESSAPSVSELTIKAVNDKALTPLIHESLASGKHFASVKLMTGSFTITMTDAFVTSIKPAGMSGGGDNPMESVTFTFRKIEWTY